MRNNYDLCISILFLTTQKQIGMATKKTAATTTKTATDTKSAAKKATKKPASNKKVSTKADESEPKQPSIDTLTEVQQRILHFVSNSLHQWRKEEPEFTNIDSLEVSKTLGLSKKDTIAELENLVKLGFIKATPQSTAKSAKLDILVIWEFVPVAFSSKAFKANKPAATSGSNKPNKQTTIEAKSTSKSTETSNKPYGLYGAHGSNTELEGFEAGDPIEFTLKGKQVVGEYRHLHINNHSPNGYVVIKFDDKFYERVVSKVSKPSKTSNKAKNNKKSTKKAA